MPITNLAIQRKRWKELSKILDPKEVISIRPYDKLQHTHFVICTKKLDYGSLERLQNAGYWFTKIETGVSMVWITVYKWEMEKMNSASREFLAKQELKTRESYNYAIVEEENKELRSNLKQRSNELCEERQKVQQLCKRIVNLYDEQKEKKSVFATFFEGLEVMLET